MKSTLKAIYSVAELAELVGETPKQMRARLRKVGLLPPGKKGSKQEVTLTAFRDALPELWESVLMVQALAA